MIQVGSTVSKTSGLISLGSTHLKSLWVSPLCKFSTILSRAGIQDRDKWQLAKKIQDPSSTPFSINLKVFVIIIILNTNCYIYNELINIEKSTFEENTILLF